MKQEKGNLSTIGTDGCRREDEKLNLRGELLECDENISRLKDDWDDLFIRVKNAPAYLSRAWIGTFLDKNNFKGKPYFIVVWSGSKLVALLPFSVRSVCGIHIGEMIGTAEPSSLGLLLDPDYTEAIPAIVETWIRKKVAHAFYNKYLSSLDNITNELIEEFHKQSFVCKRGFKNISPWLRLGCSFEEYLTQTKSGKRRKKLRYAEKQVFNSADVKIVRYIGKDVTPEVIERIVTIQQESWMKKRGVAVLGQPFYHELLIALAQANLGCVWLMTVDGNDAAFSYTLMAHKKLDLKWMAFKLKYESSVSFGKILTMQLIRDACGENIESLDLGFGDGEWKQFWATDNHDIERVVAGRGALGYIVTTCYSVTWWLAECKWLFSVYRRMRRRLNKFKQN